MITTSLSLANAINGVCFNDATEMLLNECEKTNSLLVWEREDLPENDPERLTAFNPLLPLLGIAIVNQDKHIFADALRKLAVDNGMSVLFVNTNFLGVHTVQACKFYATDLD